MSIPQPQILYTGMNVAVPDWKSFNRDFNARMDMIRREKQQQQQFEMQRQDQLNRDFLRTVNIDQINYAHGNFQQSAANIYSTFDDAVSAIVEDKKGQLTTQDIIKAKSLASRAEQELIKYKNWENNWMKDMQVIQDPRLAGNFSEESKRMVTSYDGSTPYSESRLKLDDWNPEKTADKLRSEFKDGNKASIIVKAAGLGDIEGNNSQEWSLSYLQKFYDVKKDDKGNQYVELNKKSAIDAVKARVMGQDYKLGQIGLMNSFDKIPDREKELYKQSAINSTGNEEDAMYAWFVDKYASDLFSQDRKMLQEKEPSSTGKKKQDIDVRSGLGDLRGGRVDLTGRISGAMDVDGKDVDILAGKNGASITRIEYIKNPKTGKEEWMAYGQYTKPNPDLGEVAMGKRTVTEEFLVPYNEVREPIEDKYIVKGMSSFKPKESASYTIKGKKYTLSELKDMGYSEEQVAPFKQ